MIGETSGLAARLRVAPWRVSSRTAGILAVCGLLAAVLAADVFRDAPESPARGSADVGIPPAAPAIPEAAFGDLLRAPGVALHATPAPGVEVDTVRVRSGDTVAVILRRAGVGGRQVHEAYTALGRILDVRRIRPGQTVRVERSPGDGLRQMVVAQGRTDYVVARAPGGEGFEARARERPFARELDHARGVIRSSLYLSATRARVPAAVVHEMIRLYSWSVDFQREIRAGDTFEVVYERFRDLASGAEDSGDVLFARLVLSGDSRPLFRFEVAPGVADHFDAEGKSLRRALMRTPIDGARLSSGYGKRRHPILGYNAMHRGVDFAAPRGTPFYAAGDGVVTHRGRRGSYGNYIRIRHNGVYSTAYAHLSKFRRGVVKGSRVRQGQVIGYVGSTGRSTGPHLHYEVLVNGRQVNPLSLKMKPGTSLEGEAFARFEIDRDLLLREAERLDTFAAVDRK